MYTQTLGWWLRTPCPSQGLSTGNRILSPASTLSFHKHVAGGVGRFGNEMSLPLPGYCLVAFFLFEVCLLAVPQASDRSQLILSEGQEGQAYRPLRTKQEEGFCSSLPR